MWLLWLSVPLLERCQSYWGGDKGKVRKVGSYGGGEDLYGRTETVEGVGVTLLRSGRRSYRCCSEDETWRSGSAKCKPETKAIARGTGWCARYVRGRRG